MVQESRSEKGVSLCLSRQVVVYDPSQVEGATTTEEREKEGFNKDRIMLYVKYTELFNFTRDTFLSSLLVNIL